MSDRTSAEIFGWLFWELAKEPEKNLGLAQRAWAQSKQYDFSPCQMDANKELVQLGLAREIPNPDEPDYPQYEYEKPMKRKLRKG